MYWMGDIKREHVRRVEIAIEPLEWHRGLFHLTMRNSCQGRESGLVELNSLDVECNPVIFRIIMSASVKREICQIKDKVKKEDERRPRQFGCIALGCVPR